MISTSLSGDGLLGELDDRVRALLARRRIGHADLDDLALGEQRYRAAVRDQLLPVEAALDHVQLTLGEALRARLRARIASAASLTNSGSSPETRYIGWS